ncbi:hypothetical protein D3H34_28490 [Acidovorax cavernicola]|uniref:Uncharacterized protein n=1 Tax=Acidovorax cavernicola TaxID=1675792 RepID=A0A9X8CZJ7_9BURK|nr:hypothetical protein D3H34_28490 [Acidovorax cavernicola]
MRFQQHTTAPASESYDSPPVFAHFVSLRQPPFRGQHQRPGKAGSAVFHEHATTLMNRKLQ